MAKKPKKTPAKCPTCGSVDHVRPIFRMSKYSFQGRPMFESCGVPKDTVFALRPRKAAK